MRETVLNWSLDEAMICIALLTVAALWGFYALWTSFKRYRLVHDTPTSKVRSAAQGYIELFGAAKMLEGEAIISPLTRQACCWWRYRIQKRVRSGKNTSWRTTESGESEGIFSLEDGTGRALVDPDGAEITGSKKKTWYGNSRHPGDIVSGISMFGGSYRYEEELLTNGGNLYVLGSLKSENPAGAFDLHQAVGEKLKLWKQNQAALLARFDSNGDGEIGSDEWTAARKVAKQEIEQQYASLLDQEPIHLLSKPPRGLPLLISTFPPQKLAKRYLIKAAIGVPVFLVAGGFAVWIGAVRGLL